MPIPTASIGTAYRRRRALLVLDLQKEFLDPTIGRCLLPHATNDPDAQPKFLSNITLIAPRFRNPDSDIIWIRSEFRTKRDFTDIRIDEKIHVVNEEVDGDPGLVDNHDGRKKGRVGPAGRPPLRTDAYLSIDTNHAPVAPGGKAAEFADVVKEVIVKPPDREVTKSWYSAFKDTTLLQLLRGRVITSIYICGLMTNIGVLATAADAVRHGFDVYVITDAVGYRSEEAHKQAITQMVDEYAVEEITSMQLLRDRNKGKWGKKGHNNGGVGATAMDKEELVRIMEEMELGRQEDEWEAEEDDEEGEEGVDKEKEKEKGEKTATKKKRKKRKTKPKGGGNASPAAPKADNELAPEDGQTLTKNGAVKKEGGDEPPAPKETDPETNKELGEREPERTESEKNGPDQTMKEMNTKVDLRELAARIVAQNKLEPETETGPEKSDPTKGILGSRTAEGETVKVVPTQGETNTQSPSSKDQPIELEVHNTAEELPANEDSPSEPQKADTKPPVPTLGPSIVEGGEKYPRRPQRPPTRIIPLFEEGPIEVDEGSSTENDTHGVELKLSPKRTRKDREEQKANEAVSPRPIAPLTSRSRSVRSKVVVRKRPSSTPNSESKSTVQSTMAPPTSEDFNPEIGDSPDAAEKVDKCISPAKDEPESTPIEKVSPEREGGSPSTDAADNQQEASSREKPTGEDKASPERATSEPPASDKKQQKTKKARAFESTAPVMRPGDSLGEGDSSIIYDLLPDPLSDDIFNRLRSEVSWRTMYHRGGEVPRLVAVQGSINPDGSFPIYRHPSDESPPLFPFTPTVDAIRLHVQEVLKHPLNHVLIQHYRSGNDYISEHSDKTLDIALGSNIVNVSLGAQRTMTLRGKKSPTAEPTDKRDHQRIPMPHNSLFVLGPATNRRWLHGIKQDRRIASLKSTNELGYNGERISLTFRHIATFLSTDESRIYGQGAVSKSRPRRIVNGPCPEAERLIEQFGRENHDPEFDWHAGYGSGFDVLHFNEPVVRILAGDPEADEVKRVQEAVEKVGREFKVEKVERIKGVRIVDVDRERTEIGDPVLAQLYFERFYGNGEERGEWVKRVKGILEQRADGTKEE